MEQLGVSNWLSETCRRLDIIHPTEIQKKCIPKVLKGLNVLGVSETGSGKTACFLLPIVQGFAVEARAFYALVILPTRELASQVMDQAVLFGQEAGLLSVLAVGGDSIYHQKEQMRSGVHLVVGTVGRLAQILEDDVALRKRFRRFKVVVLDEFDRILDPEYRQIGHLRKILPYFDKSPQLLFFSATFDKVKDWPRVEQHFPDLVDDVELQDVTSHSTPISIRHSFILCPKLGVYQYLNYLLRNCPDLVAPKRGILFVSKVLDSEVLVRLLVNLKHEAVCVNGVQRTSERATGLEKFRSGRGPRLLVGTDLISRGLDLPEVDFVINLSVPKNKTDYIHKAGRCGRAGRKGFVLTLVTPTLVGNRLEKDYQILQVRDRSRLVFCRWTLCKKNSASN